MFYNTEGVRLELAAVSDDDAGLGAAALAALRLHLLDDVHALDDLAEDDVLVVEPRGHNGGDEELRAVGCEAVSKCTVAKARAGSVLLGPALAMERRPGVVCFSLKFSSANFSP